MMFYFISLMLAFELINLYDYCSTAKTFSFSGKNPLDKMSQGPEFNQPELWDNNINPDEEIVAKCDGLITRVSARKRLLETLDNLTDVSDTIVSSRVLSTYLSEKDMAVALVTSTGMAMESWN